MDLISSLDSTRPLAPSQSAADGSGCASDGAGTPVVMLHSSLSSRTQWNVLAERLAGRYRAIALDLCGYGDSAMPTAGADFTLEDEIRLVAAQLDPVIDAGSRIHLVGHSYGALVALRLAQHYGARVASLSLYEPVAFRLLDDDDPAAIDVRRLAVCVSELIAAGRKSDTANAFIDFWSGDGSYGSLPLTAQASIARRIAKLPLDFQAAAGWPARPGDLRDILAPTLLMCGTRSPKAMHRIHVRLAAILRDCRPVSITTGHMGPVTDAERVNRYIEPFVDACEARSAQAAVPPGAAPTIGWPSTAQTQG
jgi:pimeloyl-ACP methyl ester carboxylesterase